MGADAVTDHGYATGEVGPITNRIAAKDGRTIVTKTYVKTDLFDSPMAPYMIRDIEQMAAAELEELSRRCL